MNIDDNIINAMEEIGFQPIATGGGCDYMVKQNWDEAITIMLTDGGLGSPQDLEDEAALIFYFTPGQDEFFCGGYSGGTYHKSFKNVHKAITFLKDEKKYYKACKKAIKISHQEALLHIKMKLLNVLKKS